jgi:hypothetical protein
MFTSKLKSLSMQTLRSRCSGLVACGARRAKRAYEPALVEKGFDAITTEILPAPTFYFAEKLPAISRQASTRLLRSRRLARSARASAWRLS